MLSLLKFLQKRVLKDRKSECVSTKIGAFGLKNMLMPQP